MLDINTDIISDIYNSQKLAKEIYFYLCSVIEHEINKQENADDKLISDCVEELMKFRSD